MDGYDFSYRGASSYEEAIALIDEGQASGMNAVEWHMSLKEQGLEVTDPNRLGPCGKKNC